MDCHLVIMKYSWQILQFTSSSLYKYQKACTYHNYHANLLLFLVKSWVWYNYPRLWNTYSQLSVDNWQLWGTELKGWDAGMHCFLDRAFLFCLMIIILHRDGKMSWSRAQHTSVYVKGRTFVKWMALSFKLSVLKKTHIWTPNNAWIPFNDACFIPKQRK